MNRKEIIGQETKQFDPVQFGARLRASMEAQGYDAERLAKEIGVSPKRLKRVLRGESSLRARHLIRIRLALGVRVDYLFGFTDETGNRS